MNRRLPYFSRCAINQAGLRSRQSTCLTYRAPIIDHDIKRDNSRGGLNVRAIGSRERPRAANRWIVHLGASNSRGLLLDARASEAGTWSGCVDSSDPASIASWPDVSERRDKHAL